MTEPWPRRARGSPLPADAPPRCHHPPTQPPVPRSGLRRRDRDGWRRRRAHGVRVQFRGRRRLLWLRSVHPHRQQGHGGRLGVCGQRVAAGGGGLRRLAGDHTILLPRERAGRRSKSALNFSVSPSLPAPESPTPERAHSQNARARSGAPLPARQPIPPRTPARAPPPAGRVPSPGVVAHTLQLWRHLPRDDGPRHL
jgi:hypothetical protein